MKRIHIVVITTCLTFSMLLLGCGGSGPGTPGSCGSEDTGVDVRPATITHSDPAGDQGDIWQMDLYLSDCAGEPEEWGDDYAHISLAGHSLYEPTVDNMLYITNYRVTYYPLNPDYPPIDELRAGAQGIITVIPESILGPYTFLVLDIGRKLELQDAISSGVYPDDFMLLYDMTIEMWGQDRYGNDFCVGPIIRPILIGPYDKC